MVSTRRTPRRPLTDNKKRTKTRTPSPSSLQSSNLSKTPPKESPKQQSQKEIDTHAFLHISLVFIFTSITPWIVVKPEFVHTNTLIFFIVAVSIFIIICLSIYPNVKALLTRSKSKDSIQFTLFWNFVVAISTLNIMLTFALISHPPFHLAEEYPEKGEPYFKSAPGVLYLIYDMFIHQSLQMYILFNSLTGRSIAHITTSIWCGSMVCSLISLLFGGAIGPFSGEIEYSTALNVPWVIMPMFVISYTAAHRTIASSKKGRTSDKIDFPAVSIALSILHIGSISLHVIRGMAMFGSNASIAVYWRENIEPNAYTDETKHALVASIISICLLLPLHIYIILQNIIRGFYEDAFGFMIYDSKTSIITIAGILFGGTVEIQSVLIGTELFKWDGLHNPLIYTPPLKNWGGFFTWNLFIVLVPLLQLLFWRVEEYLS